VLQQGHDLIADKIGVEKMIPDELAPDVVIVEGP
jgi:hypothetical protein